MANRPSVLVVDGCTASCEQVRRHLGDSYSVTEASTAAEAIRAVEANTPACVIIDYHLPDSEGLDLLAHMRGQHIPVVVMSGEGSPRVAVEAMRLGAEDYLTKEALSSDTIRAAVERALRTRSLRDALTRTEGLSDALLRAIPDSVLRFSKRGICLDMVPGRHTRLRLPADQFLGRSAHELFPDEVAEQVLEALSEVAPNTVRTIEYELEDAGTSAWHEIRASDIGPGEALMLIRDITQERAAKARLEGAVRMEAVGRLAAGIAHDFHNLLTVIVGTVSIMREDAAEDDELLEDYDLVLDTAERAARLTRQLLAFSRRQLRAVRTLDLNDVVGTTRELLQRALGEGIELGVSLPETPAVIRGDHSQLEQLIMNLAVNASEAMDGSGALRIDVSEKALSNPLDRPGFSVPPGRWIVLTIADSGAGMDDATRERVFEPFFTTKPDGSGMGLATVYGIVKQGDGYILVDSRPGEGTTFQIYLPRIDAPPSEAVSFPSSEVVPAASSTILLVEDEDAVRDVAARVLRRSGYDVIEAPDGPAALRIVVGSKMPVDLLLTDIVMPRMQGSELLERIKEHQPSIAVVVASGYSRSVAEEEWISAAGALFLPKPFSPQELLDRVAQALAIAKAS